MSLHSAANNLFLICRSDTQLYALPLSHVIETMRPLSLRTVPDMPTFVLGVSIIRGAIVPVLNGAMLAGVRPDAKPARYVTIRINERVACLAVDEVVGIRELPPHMRRDVPRLLQASDTDIVAAIGMLDAEVLVVLQSSHWVSDELWRAINAMEVQTT